MADVQIPSEVLRCPVHGIPDCSPLLNGCSIPNRLADAYRTGINSATPHYTSTACQHEVHERCRKVCKYCLGPCRCSCHQET